MDLPLVSVVIPTRGRADLLERAVRSALQQTFRDIEVIVVIDGEDMQTLKTLLEVQDVRLRVVQLPVSQGGSGARNAGVSAARGKWIAFLDDDDEWLSEKIKSQMQLAATRQSERPIVSCRSRIVTPRGEYIWPRRFPRTREPICEYLFCRSSLFQGEGFVGTPTILAPKSLLQDVPFLAGLKRHQDWDWLIRATALPGVALHFVDEPLAVLHMEERRSGISNSLGWQTSLSWIRERKDQVTKNAYGSFLMTVVSSIAARELDWQAIMPLLREAARHGKLRSIDALLFVGMWIFPEAMRRSARAWFHRRK